MTTIKRSEISPCSRSITLLLCFFIGYFGAHRFYTGKIGTAFIMIATLGGLGIWVIIDLAMILTANFRDKKGHLVYEWSLDKVKIIEDQ